MIMHAPIVPRPTPLRDIASKVSATIGVIGGLVAGLVTAGVLSSTQADALGDSFTAVDLLFSAVIGVITALSGLTTAWRTAKAGEEKVTPVASPMNNDGVRLAPLSADVSVRESRHTLLADDDTNT